MIIHTRLISLVLAHNALAQLALPCLGLVWFGLDKFPSSFILFRGKIVSTICLNTAAPYWPINLLSIISTTRSLETVERRSKDSSYSVRVTLPSLHFDLAEIHKSQIPYLVHRFALQKYE
jgi:hypothetical protein